MKIRKSYLLICVLFFTSVITACSDSSGSSGSNTKDITAPAWNAGYPKAIDIDDRIYVKASLNESGHVYCVLRHDGDPAPNVQEITDGIGEFAVDAEVRADTVTTLTFRDLSYSNAFDLYCIGADDLNNMQASAVKIDILTGAKDTVFVSQTDGKDIYIGTISFPKKTIVSAIEYARVNFPFTMARKVCVSQGSYVESVELTEGISLFGGYSQSDWSERDIEDRTGAYSTVISGVPGVNYALAISGTNSSSGDWVVEGFTIASNNSSNSYGIDCTAISLVKIRYNTINGGSGSNESNGVYLHSSATTEISNNTINGRSSTGGLSNGIFIETSADQIISNNNINGGSGNNASRGIVITHPVDYDTVIKDNIINGGSSSNESYGIYITHNENTKTSSPLIYGNIITAGSAYNYRNGIYLRGTIDTAAITPVLCNNIVDSGTGAASDAYSLTIFAIDGSAYLYNSIIIGDNDSVGIVIAGNDNQESQVSLINNMIVNTSYAIIEADSYSFCDVLKNNDLYNCTHFFEPYGSSTIDSISALNAYSGNFGGNISIDALLDSSWNFTASSPASVTGGGLGLSSYQYFQENSSGQKIDITGKVRTAPWSMGAYEKE